MLSNIKAALVAAPVAAILIISCGGADPQQAPAPDAMVDAYQSSCGVPGDMGNELGIGKFCASFGDCASTMSAPLCSVIGDSDTHFCTKTCSMGSTTSCGTGAECVCNSGNQCGCTPSMCLGR
jgi:hypothetical protein